MSKPTNWDKMNKLERFEYVNERFLKNIGEPSSRGRTIISEALYRALESMRKDSPRLQARSNIQDMEMLQEVCFPFYQFCMQGEAHRWGSDPYGTDSFLAEPYEDE